MKRLFLLLTIATFAFQVSSAQTVDEILANYFENVGGLEKLQEMETRRTIANMSMQGMEFTATIIEQEPNMQRVDVDIQGMQLVQAYDGETAWTINPFSSGTEPQKMPENEAEEMMKQTFDGPFMDYAAQGHTIELEDSEEVEGAECFKLKLTRKNGDVEYHFFDAEYYVPVMSRTTQSGGPAAGMPVETFMSDYQEVEGMMFPFFLESKINGQTFQTITVTSMELDVDVEDGFFDFPGAKPDVDAKDVEKEKMLKNAPKGDMKEKVKEGPTKAKRKKNN